MLETNSNENCDIEVNFVPYLFNMEAAINFITFMQKF